MTSLRSGLSLSQSVLSRCDGSAKFTYGSTSVLAALTGPLEVRIRDEQLDQATLQISSLPLKGLASPNHKALAYSIKLILSALLDLRRHPRSLIQLTIQTLSAPSLKYSKPFKTFTEDEEDEPDRDDRSCVEYATAMNACMVACLDAGLDMKGLAVAVGVAFVKEKGLVVDPSLELESQAEVCFVLGYSFGQDVGGEQGELVWCETLGHGNQSDWDEKILGEAIELGKSAAQHVLAFIRKSMESKYEKFIVKAEKEDETMEG